MDPLTFLLREILELFAHLPDITSSFILRAALFFGATTGLTAAAFHAGSRSQFLQLMSFGVGFLVGTFFPLGFLLDAPAPVKSSAVLLALIALAFLPARLAFFLTPSRMIQKRIRLGSYAFLLALLLISW